MWSSATGTGGPTRDPVIPHASAAQKERSAHAAVPGTRHDLCLLIVDDDPLMTDLLPRKLQRAMHAQVRIITATTPADARTIIENDRPDIVLSDFNLRDDMTGLDVLAHAAHALPRATRILFSGHAKHEIGPPLADADIHAYLEKPMKLDELIAALLKTIRETTGIELAREGSTDAGK